MHFHQMEVANKRTSFAGESGFRHLGNETSEDYISGCIAVVEQAYQAI